MKSNLTIYTDATCDLPEELVKELAIKVIPMSCMVGDKNYTGAPDDNVSSKTVYDAMRAGKKTSTGQITQTVYEEYFSIELAKGNDILHINLSSGLTGSVEQAKIAIKNLEKKFPNNRIYLVDSLSATLGVGLIVYKTAKFYNECKDAEKTYEYSINLAKNTCALFTVDDLKYLRAGGRISATKAFIGTLLQLKPVMHVNEEGKLVAISKVIGRKKALNALVDSMIKTSIPGKNNIIMIGHSDCIEEAQFVGNSIKQKLTGVEVIYNFIGPVVGAHSGPGTIAIFFEGTNRGI